MVASFRSMTSSSVEFGHAESADDQARRLLGRMFDAAIASADPAKVLAAKLPYPPKGSCIIVGAGKAAASMAAAVEAAWPQVELSGVVAVPYGYALDCNRICVREAGHPLPDANSMAAGQEILQTVRGLGCDDLVLALISGGGSAAMCLPAPGLSLDDKRVTTRLLLASGLDIRTMNAVRRRISAIKGGKLAAAAAPARVITLAISDIPGDDPAAIASGPTAGDPGSDLDLRHVVAKLGPDLPACVAELLSMPAQPVIGTRASEITLIATPRAALEAAAEVARAQSAFTQWNALKTSKNPGDADAINAFLIWLVLGKKLQGR
jgi:hydroxypyruvate reductase